MKKIARILAVLAAAATLGLGLASCDNGSGNKKNDDGPTYTPGTDTGSGGTTSTTTTSTPTSGTTTTPTASTGTDPASSSDVIQFRFSPDGTYDGGGAPMDREEATSLGFAYGIPLDTVLAIKPSATPPASGTTKYFLGCWRTAWDDHGGIADFSNLPEEAYIFGWVEGSTLYYFAYGYSDQGRKIPLSYCHFWRCSNVTEIDVSGLDTSRMSEMFAMFHECRSLTTIRGLESLDTSSVTHMGAMFEYCESLTSLDLSGWDTSNVWRMDEMFNGCISLTSLDLSSWDTSDLEHIDDMFAACFSLTTIYASPSFVAPSTNGIYLSMFRGCTSLVGGAGTAYDSSHNGADYARIDGGPSAPGYFTAK